MKTFLTTLGVSSLLVASASFATPSNNAAELNKAGYSIGYQMGRQFHTVGLNVPASAITQGFKEGIGGKASHYTKEETKTIMMAFQALFQQKDVLLKIK